jgi:vacuolar-type H+-ATPase subunit E/Vma4
MKDTEAEESKKQIREMLDRRYHEITTGKVKAVDGKEAFAILRKRSEIRRAQQQRDVK